MNSQPLITIITPSYNREAFLPETIESIVSQGFQHLEYIVLDDGSTDGTERVLSRYKSHIISAIHPNMGEARTVNRGFALSKGDIIGVVNSDDPLLPGSIACIKDYFDNNPDVAVVYPDFLKIDEKGAVLEKIEVTEYDFRGMLTTHNCMPGPGTFFRREILDSVQGRNPQFLYVSDFDFWLRVGLHFRFARLPMTLATFREHSGSLSNQQGSRMAEEHVRLLDVFFSQPNIPDNVIKMKRLAYASAFFHAACICNDDRIKATYLRESFRHSGLRHLYASRGRLRHFFKRSSK